MNCRHCGQPVGTTFVDLGTSPPSNAYIDPVALSKPEIYLPLKVLVCETCWLVQTEDYAAADDLFAPDYAYFSSASKSWLDHAARYATHARETLDLGADSLVIEVASNDGYLLRNFIAAGIPCLGIEPTASTARASQELGIEVLQEFFGEDLARRLADEGRQADLIAGNNVYAHVPDINDFTAGLRVVLKPGGTITLEFPHLMRLIEQAQFDTIYHEHFSYLSLYTVVRIFAAHGLRVFDVEELGTHGGSLRVYGCHANDPRKNTDEVARVVDEEERRGLRSKQTYVDFQARVEAIKNDFLSFLIEQKRAGRRVVGYGAAAKGNTLLNYAGVRRDLVSFVCDAAASKQGRYLPGSRIPILTPAAIDKQRPDVIVIFPWNLIDEILDQLNYARTFGVRFVTFIPEMKEVA